MICHWIKLFNVTNFQEKKQLIVRFVKLVKTRHRKTGFQDFLFSPLFEKLLVIGWFDKKIKSDLVGKRRTTKPVHSKWSGFDWDCSYFSQFPQVLVKIKAWLMKIVSIWLWEMSFNILSLDQTAFLPIKLDMYVYLAFAIWKKWSMDFVRSMYCTGMQQGSKIRGGR